MKKINSKYKIELIRWYDSYGCTSGWQEIESIESLLICETVGFVISETKDIVSLANSVARETDDTLEQANGVMTIPKIAIKERYEL